MMQHRVPLLDANNRVVNVTAWDLVTPWTPPSGLSVGEPSDTVQVGDVWDGTQYVPTPRPQLEEFSARDLVALLTPDDYAAISAAMAGNAQVGLWWSMLLARGEAPIRFDGATFTQAWAALTAVLGEERADAIEAALR